MMLETKRSRGGRVKQDEQRATYSRHLTKLNSLYDVVSPLQTDSRVSLTGCCGRQTDRLVSSRLVCCVQSVDLANAAPLTYVCMCAVADHATMPVQCTGPSPRRPASIQRHGRRYTASITHRRRRRQPHDRSSVVNNKNPRAPTSPCRCH